MSSDRDVVRGICRALVLEGGSTQYMWLDDDRFAYEVEIVICRVIDKTRQTERVFSEPAGIYHPPVNELH
jgi:hypothetical protein